MFAGRREGILLPYASLFEGKHLILLLRNATLGGMAVKNEKDSILES
jgi:hypothetical protein